MRPCTSIRSRRPSPALRRIYLIPVAGLGLTMLIALTIGAGTAAAVNRAIGPAAVTAQLLVAVPPKYHVAMRFNIGRLASYVPCLCLLPQRHSR
jgi:hypothetical protein